MNDGCGNVLCNSSVAAIAGNSSIMITADSGVQALH
jgi:hypothetical protein